MKNRTLNNFCNGCKQLNNPCTGSFEKAFSNCVYKRTWLSNGEKVKVKSDGKIGKIIYYDYTVGRYFVSFDKGWTFPHYKNELGEA